MLLAFVVLFVAYQAPNLLMALGVPRDRAALAMLAVIPLAAALGWASGQGATRAYGLQAIGSWWKWLLGLFAVAVIAKGIALVVGTQAGIYVSHGPFVPSPSIGAWAGLAVVTFVPSLAEDILTRGIWKHSPLTRHGALFVLGTALVYTLNHLWRLALGTAEWVMLLCFGIAYATAFWRTGTLWAAVGLHWGWNLAGQAADAIWQLDVVQSDRSKLLSAAAHLVVALGIVVRTNRRKQGLGG